MKKLALLSPLLFVLLIPFQVSASTTYATWDPSGKDSSVTLSGGNLTASKTNPPNAYGNVRSTIGKSSGKWYWEVTLASSSGNGIIGVGNASALLSTPSFSDSNQWQYDAIDGDKYNNSDVAYGSAYTDGDVIGVALDMDSGTITFYKNNVSQGTAFTGLGGTMFALLDQFYNGQSATANFGASALTYSPPAGYNAGLYDSVATGTVNRLAKFVTSTVLGDALFSDDGSNTTLTSGNLLMQINALIDAVTSGTINLGTSNATTVAIGKTGATTTINSSLTVSGTLKASSSFFVPAAYGIDTLTAGTLNIGTSTATAITIGKSGVTTTLPGAVSWGSALTTSNCSSTSTPASCGSAPAGSVAMPTGGSTLVVNTTAVTANSQMFVIEDSSLGSRLGITCNTTTGRVYSISARISTSSPNFTIKSSANPATNKACLSYWIIN